MSRYKVTYANGKVVEEEILPVGSDLRPIYNGVPYGEFSTTPTGVNADLSPAYPLGYKDADGIWKPIPKCDTVPFKQVDRIYKASSPGGNRVHLYKYRLPIYYRKSDASIRGIGGFTLATDYTVSTAKITSFKIIDLKRNVTLTENFHYIILGNGWVWFTGSLPYPNLKLEIGWYDAINNKNNTSVLEVSAIFDASTNYGDASIFGEKRENVYTVEQSTKNTSYSETLRIVSGFNSTPTVQAVKALNPLGPWREPVIYNINDGECYVEVDIDGSKIYYNANMEVTTAKKILDDSIASKKYPYGIYLDNDYIQKEFETGLVLNGVNAKGLFQIAAPDEITLNNRIKTAFGLPDGLYSQYGIKNISVKYKGLRYRVYQLWTGDDITLPVGYRFFIDSRRRQEVPYRQCYSGLRTEYVVKEEYEVKWERIQPCYGSDSANPPVMQYSSSIEYRENVFVDWEDQVLNRDIEGCGCLEVENILEPYEIQELGCGCKRYTRAEYYLVCPDVLSADDFKIYDAGNRGDDTTSIVRTDLLEKYELQSFFSKILSIESCKPPIKIDQRKSLIYHTIPTSSIINGNIQTQIHGLFNASESIDCYTTASNASASNSYFYDVYGCNECDKSPYFTVTYGNYNGSGSTYTEDTPFDTPSKAIYSQYRLSALDLPETKFTFYNTGSLETPDDIYVINFYRKSIGDKLDIGNFEINLAGLSGSGVPNNLHTGSSVQVSGSNPKIITLIDNSSYTDFNYCNEDPYASYDVVSGSLENGIHDTATGSISTNSNITTYGKVYPALGIMVLSATRLNDELAFNTVTGSNINGDNSFKLYTAISGAAAVGNSMKARREKNFGVKHYFIHIPHDEANYTNNPSYVSGSGNKLKYHCMSEQPLSYITSIGLYNDSYELLAVAKMSSPIQKSFDDDLLVRIKLAR